VWDYTDVVDLLNRQVEHDDERQERFEKRELVEQMWKLLPRANQAHFEIDALLRYADIAIVDDKGDSLHKFPHLYVDRTGKESWFVHAFASLVRGEEKIWLPDDYKRVTVFQKSFVKHKLGRIHTDKPITLDTHSLDELGHYRLNTLFETDGRYAFLAPSDVVPVANVKRDAGATYIKVTHRESTAAKQYLDQQPDGYRAQISMRQQLGREVGDDEVINIFEITPIYKHQLEDPKL